MSSIAQIPWTDISIGMGALLVIYFIYRSTNRKEERVFNKTTEIIGKLVGNHMNHMTQTLEKGFDRLAQSNDKLAESHDRLREHCVGEIAKRAKTKTND